MLSTMYPPNSDILVTARAEEHKSEPDVKEKLVTQNQPHKTHNGNSIKKKNNNTYQVTNRRRYNNNYSHQNSKKASIELQSSSSESSTSTHTGSMVMNNLPTTTAITTSASYTLDFLHYVGVQMTAGSGNGILTTSSVVSPNTQRHNETELINNNSNSRNQNYFSINNYRPQNVKEDRTTAVIQSINSPVIGNTAVRGIKYHNSQIQNQQQSNSNYVQQGHPFQQQQHQVNNYHVNNNYNRNNHNHVKKNWNSNYQKFKKNSIINSNNNNPNNINQNKYGNSSTINPANQRNQISRNANYIQLDNSNHDSNSFSPPRDTKSESPSLGTQRSYQSTTTISPNIVASQLITTSMPSIDTRCSTNQYIPVEYDSDSSHSSFRHAEYAFRQNRSPHYQFSDLPSSSSHQHMNDELFLRGHMGYYGSHQNLSIWHSGFQQNYSSPGFYSNTGHSDERLAATNDGEQNKRSYSGRNSPQGNKTYRGRKNISHHYTNHRVPNFNESNHQYTPPDRFLTRAHLVEIKIAPSSLLNGSKWDKLSQMVWDKFLSAQQSEETYKKKMYLWRYLYLCVKKMYPRYGLYLVGSTISGFGSDSSDVDMCLVSRLITDLEPRLEAMMHLTHLQDHLSSTTGIFDTFNLIQAKVPILRFKDSLHLLEVDLNFNNCVGIRNTHLLYCYSQLDWRLRPLALVVKLWAQFHHINNAKDMTISSYSLVLMTIHFLQFAINPPVLPCLHALYPQKFQKLHDINSIDMNEDLDPYYSDNNQKLGELFLQFLDYYSNFDYSQYAISIRTATVLPIEKCRLARSPKNDPHQWKELCIEEPFDLTNTARSVYDSVIFERIKSVFVTSWQTLQETMDLNTIFTMPFLTPSSCSTPSS